MTRDEKYMTLALEQAKQALFLGEIAVGAVVVRDDIVISSGYNRKKTDRDPTSHAEIIAIRKASQITGDWRLIGCELFCTLEPCLMCAGAILGSRFRRVVFGAFEPNEGFFGSITDLSSSFSNSTNIEVLGGILINSCKEMLLASFDNGRE